MAKAICQSTTSRRALLTGAAATTIAGAAISSAAGFSSKADPHVQWWAKRNALTPIMTTARDRAEEAFSNLPDDLKNPPYVVVGRYLAPDGSREDIRAYDTATIEHYGRIDVAVSRRSSPNAVARAERKMAEECAELTRLRDQQAQAQEASAWGSLNAEAGRLEWQHHEMEALIARTPAATVTGLSIQAALMVEYYEEDDTDIDSVVSHQLARSLAAMTKNGGAV